MAVQTYFTPQSLDEAVRLLAEHGPSLLVMAGGTITMPLINEGVSTPEMVMGLRQAGLAYIRQSGDSVAIGAATTLTELLGLGAIPMLQQAAGETAAWTIRNMGTVGGNLFAPPPAGDVATALLALDAQVKLVSQSGQRSVSLAEFWTGFMTTVMAPDELLAEIVVPIPSGRTGFVKYGRKHSNTPAVVTVAAHLTLEGEQVASARLALGAVGPHPLRARQAEAQLEGAALNAAAIAAAAEAAASECEPFTDAIATAWYRQRMVKVYVARLLSHLAGEEG